LINEVFSHNLGQHLKSSDYSRLPAFVMPAASRAGPLVADTLGVLMPAALVILICGAILRRHRLGED
jgi:hypothetical protein